MYGYMLQDWFTARLASSQADLIQSESDWMSFQPYQDIIFWLEATSVTLDGATNIQVSYETSPTKDNSLFLPMTAAEVLTAPTTQPTITKVLLSQNPDVPLARWVRWRIAVTGTPTTEWGLCFRIHCAANAVGVL